MALIAGLCLGSYAGMHAESWVLGIGVYAFIMLIAECLERNQNEEEK